MAQSTTRDQAARLPTPVLVAGASPGVGASRLGVSASKRAPATATETEYVSPRVKAVRRLVEVLENPKRPNQARARAALELAELAYDDGSIPAARAFLARSRQLDAKVRNEAFEMRVLVRSGDFEGALEIGENLLRRRSQDLQLHQEVTDLHLSLGNFDQAVTVSEAAYRLVTRKKGHPLRNEIAVKLAFAHHKASGGAEEPAFSRHINRAIEIGLSVLATDPEHFPAHELFLELGLPDFEGPHRHRVEGLLRRGNALYRSGEYQEVKAVALELLKNDPLDGLGHNLYVKAETRLKEQENGVALLDAIDSPQKRARLVNRLEALAARSRRPDGSAASITDLFPQWASFTEMQRGCIAYSVLPFGKVISRVIAAGGVYHFVGPGQHIGLVVSSVPYRVRDVDGRTWYGLRGFYDGNMLLVTGLESVDDAARGRYNIVTHEFSHLVHAALRHDAADWGTGQVTTFDDALMALYSEASSGADGQLMLDAYSQTNHQEYWAHGVLAYLNHTPEHDDLSPTMLFQRNPNLFRFVRDRVQRWQAFPREAPFVAPPERGLQYREDDAEVAEAWLREHFKQPDF